MHKFNLIYRNVLYNCSKYRNLTHTLKYQFRHKSTSNQSITFINDGNLSTPVKIGYETKVGYWLLGCAGLTFGVMTVGAYVRLRESGLSMINWRFLGLPLPSNDEEWLREFSKYKETPEYKLVHSNITLEEYKNIFINEWFHRMVGRGAGLFFGAGGLYFLLTGAFNFRGYLLLSCLSTLGVLQAFIGRWMVDSGFVEPTTENKTPRVSPYRLTLHFMDAFLIYTLCVWNGLKLLSAPEAPLLENSKIRKVRKLTKLSLLLTVLTIFYGTVVAGNDAGIGYNTWPKMLDRYIPDEVCNIKDYRQLFENTATVQFIHRNLAYMTVVSTLCTFLSSRDLAVPRSIKKKSIGVLHASVLQLVLGIITIIKSVPVHAALTHHVNGILLWTLLISLFRKFK